MATRKKPAAKRVPAKKPAQRPAKAKAVEVEIVPDVPDLMPAEVVKRIGVIENQLGQVDGLSDLKLCNMIQRYAKQAGVEVASHTLS